MSWKTLRIHVEADARDPALFHVWRTERGSEYGPVAKDRYEVRGEPELLAFVAESQRPTLNLHSGMIFDDIHISCPDPGLAWKLKTLTQGRNSA